MDDRTASETPVRDSTQQQELIRSLYTQDNVSLEKQYIENQRQYSIVNLELREAEEEVADLTSSYKSLQNEFVNVRLFTRAGRSKLDTELNLLQLADKERNKLLLTMNEMKNKKHSLDDLLRRLESALKISKDKLECLLAQKLVDQERLNELLEEFRAKEDDVHMYEMYTKLDQSKIKDLLWKISQLSDVYSERKETFEKETTDSKALKYSLNKMIEEANKLHLERISIIARLQRLTEQTKRKERDIDLINKMTRDLESDLKGKLEKISEKEELLAAEVEENEELLRRVEGMRDQRRKIKNEITEMDLAIGHLKGDHHTLRTMVDRAALELEIRRMELTHIKQEIMTIVDRLKRVAVEICRMIRAKDTMMSSFRDSDERAKNSLEEMKNSELLRKKAENELSELATLEYANERKIKELKDRKKWLLTRIALTKKGYIKADEELLKMDKVGLQKMKFLFVKELTVQMMARKVKQMEGHMLYLEQAELTEQIKMKTSIKDECIKAVMFWSSQSRDVKGNLHRIKYNWEKTVALKKAAERNYIELILQISIANKVLQETNNKRKDALIEESIYRVGVDRLKGILARKTEEVLTLEKVKEQLDCHMQSKKIEIEANKLQFKSRIQLAKEMNHELSAEVEEKKVKAQQLSKKYQVLIAFVQTSNCEDSGDSVLSFAMKSVQEREELRMKGNQLDINIKKAEKELQAMKNAAAVIRCTNQQRVMRGVDFEKELAEKGLLENQLKKISTDIASRKKQIKEILENSTKKKSHIEALVTKFQEKNGQALMTEEQWKSNQASLSRQEFKLKRALRLFRSKINKNRSNPHIRKLVRDLESSIIEQLHDRSAGILQRVFEKFPHIQTIVEKKMTENDIRSPLEGDNLDETSMRELHGSLSSLRSKCSRMTSMVSMLFLRKELRMAPMKGLVGYKQKTIMTGDQPPFKSPDHMTKVALRKEDSDRGLNVSEFFIKDDNVGKSVDMDAFP